MLIGERVSENPRQFWLDELENNKILLVEIEKAILAITSSGGVQSYSLDTGQSRQTVTKADLSSLYTQKNKLLQTIDDLERKLGLHGGARVIVPAF